MRAVATVGARRRVALIVRAVFAALVVCVIVVGNGRTAFAHAGLESTEPASGSVVADSPSQLVLRFSGAVDPVPGGIRVVASDGVEVDLGPAGRIDGSTSTIAVDLPALADGTYVVAWRAVSADSHPIAGAFTFSVGSTSEPLPGLVDDLLQADSPLAGASTVLAAGRWASYAGIAVALGVLVCGVLLGSPLTSRRVRRTVVSAAGVAVVGTLVMLGTQAAITVNRWAGFIEIDAWRATLEASAGRWWAIRIVAVMAVVAGGLAGYRAMTRRREVFAVFLVGCVAAFAIVAAGGHSVSGRAVPIGFAATVAHLASMTLWIGGLATIALTSGGQRLGVARRFSPIALAAVVALAGTGLVNAWRQIGTFNGLTDTSYGRWLVVKSTIVVLVVAVAAATRWLVAHTSSDPEAGDAAPDGQQPRVRIGRLVSVELAGLVLVLVATAFLVNSPPARAVAVRPASISVVNGERIVQVTVDPARTGGTLMHVYITSPSILDEPDEIVVQVSLPAQGIGPLVIETFTAGAGHVTSPNAVFPLPGTWTVEVRARYGEFDLVTFTGQIVIR